MEPQATATPTVRKLARKSAVFAAEHHSTRTSHIERKPINADINYLHRLLGHPGPEVMKHLPSNVLGITPSQISNSDYPPKTIDCDTCSLAKAHKIVSRRSGHELGTGQPFERLAIDLIKLDQPRYNNHKLVFHAYDVSTKFNFVFTIERRDKATLFELINRLDSLIKKRFGTCIKYLAADDDRGYGHVGESLRGFCNDNGITFECRAPYTEE